MNISNSVLLRDIEHICKSSYIDFNKFKNSTILITGATGLLGSILVKALLLKNEQDCLNIKIVLVVRSISKANALFGESDVIEYVENSVETFSYEGKVDYIIHGASPTKSKFFIEKPVETIDSIVGGTKNVLSIAKDNNVKGMIYLSSMEMYGTMDAEHVTEEQLGYINPKKVRSSYSEGKRFAELLCYSYSQEYNVPVKIARIAQTFGPGISKEENRVYRVFADAVIKGEDIVLKSKGTTIINYSYTTDTVIGLLFLLFNGKNGDSYNLVGNKTNMTILDSAKWLAEEFTKNRSNVVIDIPKQNAGFAPDNKMVLSNEKIVALGWKPEFSLKDGYRNLISYLKEEYSK